MPRPTRGMTIERDSCAYMSFVDGADALPHGTRRPGNRHATPPHAGARAHWPLAGSRTRHEGAAARRRRCYTRLMPGEGADPLDCSMARKTRHASRAFRGASTRMGRSRCPVAAATPRRHPIPSRHPRRPAWPEATRGEPRVDEWAAVHRHRSPPSSIRVKGDETGPKTDTPDRPRHGCASGVMRGCRLRTCVRGSIPSRERVRPLPCVAQGPPAPLPRHHEPAPTPAAPRSSGSSNWQNTVRPSRIHMACPCTGTGGCDLFPTPNAWHQCRRTAPTASEARTRRRRSRQPPAT